MNLNLKPYNPGMGLALFMLLEGNIFRGNKEWAGNNMNDFGMIPFDHRFK